MTMQTEGTTNARAAARIRAELGRMHMPQGALARHIGWTEAYLSRRMNDEVQFTTGDLDRIAQALEIPVSVLTSE